LGYLGFGTGRGGTFKITITASNTNYTGSGGFSIAFKVMISLSLRFFNASSAFFNYGFAFDNSFSQYYEIASASLTFALTSASSIATCYLVGSIAYAYA
jgi:hypothetical protein